MIRQVRIEDFEQIRKIKEKVGLLRTKLSDSKYKEKIEQEGFVLFPNYSQKDFKKDVEKLFLVYETDNKIKGYIRIESQQEMTKSSSVIWEKPEMQQIYFSSPHADIDGIVVDPDFSHQGIATKLLENAIQNIQGTVRWIFSFVVFSPIRNIPSINWHEKNGFERIAQTHYDHRFDLDNYQSILYAKKL